MPQLGESADGVCTPQDHHALAFADEGVRLEMLNLGQTVQRLEELRDLLPSAPAA